MWIKKILLKSMGPNNYEWLYIFFKISFVQQNIQDWNNLRVNDDRIFLKGTIPLSGHVFNHA